MYYHPIYSGRQACGRTRRGNTGFLHLSSAVLALMLIARMIQLSLSLVDREVESCVIIIIIINDTLARSLEPVVTECKEHTIHTQTQVVASRKPKELKRTHEGEATSPNQHKSPIEQCRPATYSRINRSPLVGYVRVTVPRFELTSQRQKVSRLQTEPPGRPAGPSLTSFGNNTSSHRRKDSQKMAIEF